MKLFVYLILTSVLEKQGKCSHCAPPQKPELESDITLVWDACNGFRHALVYKSIYAEASQVREDPAGNYARPRNGVSLDDDVNECTFLRATPDKQFVFRILCCDRRPDCGTRG